MSRLSGTGTHAQLPSKALPLSIALRSGEHIPQRAITWKHMMYRSRLPDDVIKLKIGGAVPIGPPTRDGSRPDAA